MHSAKRLLAAALLAIGLVACGDRRVSDHGADGRLPWATCRLEADASFSLDLGYESNRKLLLRGELGQAEPAEQRAMLEKLRVAMTGSLRNPEYVDEHGACRLTLRLEASPLAKWRYALWIVQTAADPRVGIHAIDLRLQGEDRSTSIDLAHDGFYSEELETDDDLDEANNLDAPDEGKRLNIRFFRRSFNDPPNAYTLIKVADQPLQLPKAGRPGGAEYDEAMAAVDSAIDEAMGSLTEEGVVEISAPMPKGPHVPYGEVLQLIRRVRAAGRRRVLLESTPAPAPGWR